MIRKILVDGESVWCKSYAPSAATRRAVTALWNRLVGALGVHALRSPPRRAGDGVRQLEQRRIGELHGRGVRVPEIVAARERVLVLRDLGPTLSGCLKQASDATQVDQLVHRSVAALVAAHRGGAYLGQAVARNIVLTGTDVGFIDFEEDPLEVMSLREAQAGDWLLFSSSIGRYYETRLDDLTAIFRDALPAAGNDVAATVGAAARRLGFLPAITRRLGRRARALGVAVASLRRAAAHPPSD